MVTLCKNKEKTLLTTEVARASSACAGLQAAHYWCANHPFNRGGIFFSGTIFFGASGTLEIRGLRILVCIAEEVPFFWGKELTL